MYICRVGTFRHCLAYFFAEINIYYLHFFQDFVESLKQLSLIFQKKELLICKVPRLLDEKITNIGVINEIGDGLKRLMENLTENTNGEISYKNDVILSLASGRRENLQHKKQVHFETYTRKFDEIILETQIQLRNKGLGISRLSH